MALPFSAGEIFAVYNLATKAYHAWNEAGEQYSDIANTLESIIVILRHIETEASTSHSILNAEELDTILHGLRDTIRRLDSIVTEHKNLDSGWQGSWDRVTFAMKDLEPLRTKLTRDLARITAYQTSLHTGSLGRIERQNEVSSHQNNVHHEITHAGIAGMTLEIQRLTRRSSVMTKYDNGDTRVWRQFRRDFVGNGMRSSTMQKYTPQIQNLLRELSEKERLRDVPDEAAEDEGYDEDMPPVGVEQNHGRANLWHQEPRADYGAPHAEYMHPANPELYTTLTNEQDGGRFTPDDMHANSENRTARTGWKIPWAKKRTNSGFLRK